MLVIKIPGANCPKCRRLEQEVHDCLNELKIDCEIVKLDDFTDFMQYGILKLPGLVINDVLLSTGRVPLRSQIAAWVAQVQSAEKSISE